MVSSELLVIVVMIGVNDDDRSADGYDDTDGKCWSLVLLMML